MPQQNYLDELTPAFTPLLAIKEASRCLLCHDAPCSQACPAQTDPGKFIRSIYFRNFKGAAETIRENNALGAVCARVCPTEKLCQSGCTRAGVDTPIDIGRLQRFVTDFEQQTGMEIYQPGTKTLGKVAIIGAGPAGLQASVTLTNQGYDVTIYEKEAQAGGWLRNGIPQFRLPQSVLDAEIARIEKMGVTIKCNNEIGKTLTLEQLKAENRAVLVTVGLSSGSGLPLFEHSDIEIAVDFLHRARQAQGDISIPQSALIIGGGDVAMDVASTLKVLGCQAVTCVAREELDEFPASEKEFASARELGVSIIDGFTPVAVEGNKVTFKHVRLPGELTMAAKRGGADGIAAINTVKSITNIDLNQKIGMPIVNGKSSISGYSGKAVKPIALRFIQQMHTHPELRDFPISGIGGIETWEDAAEFLLLGAATLQVTTGIMQYGYRIVEDMASGLSHYLADQGFDSLQDMVGLANNNIVPAEDLDRSYIVYPHINLDKCVGCGRCYISCYDGGHQAMEWSEKTRTPHCNTEKCVGCLLCGHVCPVGCIDLGEVKFKKGEKEHPVTL
ncbi:NAD-dependent dihydropyrimidine dehydrogenase subunit PreA [Escherichia coli]|nr:NAD-dependent dihydropyrimidine dehydrogenase subunit PreA [Escherichia coli]